MTHGVPYRTRRQLARAYTELEQDYLSVQRALAALVVQQGGAAVIKHQVVLNLDYEVVINVDRDPVSGETRLWTSLDGKPYKLASPAGQPARAHAHSLPPRGGGGSRAGGR